MEFKDRLKEYRLKQQLTQEALAEKLHVSHAAVSKWENGCAYPSLDLLPVLARVFHTDINTLMSFEATLSGKEINEIVTKLAQIKTYEDAYAYGKEQLFLYPTCDLLRLCVADTLRGKAVMEHKDCDEECYAWYEGLCQSEDENVRYLSISRMAQYESGRGNFDKAQAWINQLPQRFPIDVNQMKLQLCIAQKDYDQAEQMCEEQLFVLSNQYIAMLGNLIELRCQKQDFDGAKAILEKVEAYGEVMGVWKYSIATCRLIYAKAIHDADVIFKSYQEMMDSINEPVFVHDVFYPHLTRKEISPEFRDQMKQMLKDSFQQEQDLDALKGDPCFAALFS